MFKSPLTFLVSFSACWAGENSGLDEVNKFLNKCKTTSIEINNEAGVDLTFDVTYKSEQTEAPLSALNLAHSPNTVRLIDTSGEKPAKRKLRLGSTQANAITVPLFHSYHLETTTQQHLYRAPTGLYFQKIKAQETGQTKFYIKEAKTDALVVGISTESVFALTGLFKSVNIASAAASARKRSVETKLFTRRILPLIKIQPSAFYSKLNVLYNKNLPHLKGTAHGEELRIPKIIHSIWVTDPSTPKEPNDKAAEYLYETMLACPPSDGYRYIYWINDPESLPKLCSHPLNSRDESLEKLIEFKTVKELDLISPFDQHYENALKAKNFGMASDILRCVILSCMGGIYRDDDYQILHNLDHLLRKCDFIGGIEAPDLCFVGNALVATKPHHPILEQCKLNIARNLGSTDAPPYLKKLPPILHTLFATGPFMLSTTLYDKADQEGNVDVILPGNYLYPAIRNINGQKKNDPYPEILGIHFQAKSWVKEVKTNNKQPDKI